MNDILKGFSKLSREEKTRRILEAFSSDPQQAARTLHNYLHADPALEALHEGFAENTLANYYLPFCVAPNFRINGRMYAVPMVIEESSVVAALSKSAAFWAERGGFSARTLSAVKKGQIHLLYTEGKPETLSEFFLRIRPQLLEATEPLTEKMRARGGGITSLELKDCTDRMDGYYQIDLSADTRDSMGANFINSVLEAIASRFRTLAEAHSLPGRLEILMSILSNYTPDCRAEAVLECPVEEMAIDGFSGEDFCRRFVAAVHIASLSVSRAVTHNKGIMNGVDDKNFAPEDAMTRAMFVTVLARLSGDTLTEQTSFSDVPAGQWYSAAVSWAAENGIVLGYPDGTFAPDKAVSREDAMTLLVRFAGWKALTLP